MTLLFDKGTGANEFGDVPVAPTFWLSALEDSLVLAIWLGKNRHPWRNWRQYPDAKQSPVG
jgi:hypothetical protein